MKQIFTLTGQFFAKMLKEYNLLQNVLIEAAFLRIHEIYQCEKELLQACSLALTIATTVMIGTEVHIYK